MDIISLNYSNGVNLTSTFINPFNESFIQDFTIQCPYCSQIGDQAQSIKQQLNSSIGGQLGEIDGLLNETRSLTSSKDGIKTLTQQIKSK